MWLLESWVAVSSMPSPRFRPAAAVPGRPRRPLPQAERRAGGLKHSGRGVLTAQFPVPVQQRRIERTKRCCPRPLPAAATVYLWQAATRGREGKLSFVDTNIFTHFTLHTLTLSSGMLCIFLTKMTKKIIFYTFLYHQQFLNL